MKKYLTIAYLISTIGCSAFNPSNGMHAMVYQTSGCPNGWSSCYYDPRDGSYVNSDGVFQNSPSNSSGNSFTVADFEYGSEAIQVPTFADSASGDTKDVDLQRSDFQQSSITNRAQSFANQFQMDFGKALQLIQLADKVHALTLRGELTTQERQTIIDGTLATTGIKSDEVNGAIAGMIQNGDQTAMNLLMDKAAKNLGMPSSAGLRDQLLPALGIHL